MNRRTFMESLTVMASLVAANKAEGTGSPLSSTFIEPASGPGSPRSFNSRHIHLDQHTPPEIPDVGAEFSAEEFARTLSEARVNSITCFAKCHHGMAYYNTRVGFKHPALKQDLLGEMTDACHRRGINIPAYINVMLDQRLGRLRPEWRNVNRKQEVSGPLSGWGFTPLCINSPFMDYIADLTEEVVAGYDVDGFFFDIFVSPPEGCFCRWCVEDREKLGLDAEDPMDLFRHSKIITLRGMERLDRIIKSHKPGAFTFYNGRVHPGMRDELKYFSHLEIESLPTGGWGYDHCQIMFRYARNLGKPVIGQTGRFHRSWGDFGGVRTHVALDCDCALMQANGLEAVGIGDHLPPRGKLEPAAYEEISKTYHRVEENEPWCTGAKALTEIGVLMSGACRKMPAGYTLSDQGALRMLLELHHQFDFLDLESDLQRYKLVILPDECFLTPSYQDKLADYLKNGGSLLLSGYSAMDESKHGFILNEIGVSYVRPSPFKVDYFRPREGLQEGLPRMDHMLYGRSIGVKAQAESSVLADIVHPYFDVSKEHFVVEYYPPQKQVSEFAAVVQKGKVIYIASSIFRVYREFAYTPQRQLVSNCIRRLLPQPLVKTTASATAEITLTEQAAQKRIIVHAVHFVPEHRGTDLDFVEDVFPVFDTKIEIRTAARPKQVYLAPKNRALAADYLEPYVSVVVPEIKGHQMIVLQF